MFVFSLSCWPRVLSSSFVLWCGTEDGNDLHLVRDQELERRKRKRRVSDGGISTPDSDVDPSDEEPDVETDGFALGTDRRQAELPSVRNGRGRGDGGRSRRGGRRKSRRQTQTKGGGHGR